MIKQMAARHSDFGEKDLIALFLCVEEVFSEDECAVGTSSSQTRHKQRGLVLNSV